jgi:hypothetical protein
MSDTILAIDLGRHKSVACVYHRSSHEHSFRTFDTTPAALTKLLVRPRFACSHPRTWFRCERREGFLTVRT